MAGNVTLRQHLSVTWCCSAPAGGRLLRRLLTRGRLAVMELHATLLFAFSVPLVLKAWGVITAPCAADDAQMQALQQAEAELRPETFLGTALLSIA